MKIHYIPYVAFILGMPLFLVSIIRQDNPSILWALVFLLINYHYFRKMFTMYKQIQSKEPTYNDLLKLVEKPKSQWDN